MDRERARRLDRVTHGSSSDPSILDVSANINPVTPDGVEAVYEAALEESRRYPPEPPLAFMEAAAAHVGCDPAQIIPTAGGMAALRLAIALYVNQGTQVLLPAPSFGEYEREVRLHGGTPEWASADTITEMDPSSYGLAIVCQPNNPTGNAYPRSTLTSFADRCREADTMLLVDEAFIEYTDRETMAAYPGTIVARSLTKIFGVPGIRMGFAVATGQPRDSLEGARRPWNVSSPALAVGTHCLRDQRFIEHSREAVARERDRMVTALKDRYGVYPSEAPFLLLECVSESVDEVLVRAQDARIALRDARSFGGLDNHIRIAIRRPAENDRVLKVLLNA